MKRWSKEVRKSGHTLKSARANCRKAFGYSRMRMRSTSTTNSFPWYCSIAEWTAK